MSNIKTPNIFVVVAEGVYRQEIGGVFDKESEAIEAAKMLAAKEADMYHTWLVIPFILGETNIREQPSSYRTCAIEPYKSIFEANKSNASKH